MEIRPNEFGWRTYLIVAAIAFVAGFIGGTYWWFQVGNSHELPALSGSIWFGVWSSITWCLILRFLAPRSWWTAILIGLLSPFVASAVAMLALGFGIYSAFAVVLTYPKVAPIGVVTALVIYPFMKPKPQMRGFDVVLRAKNLEED